MELKSTKLIDSNTGADDQLDLSYDRLLPQQTLNLANVIAGLLSDHLLRVVNYQDRDVRESDMFLIYAAKQTPGSGANNAACQRGGSLAMPDGAVAIENHNAESDH